MLRVASMLVSAAMVPLMIGLCLDIYVVAHVITMHAAASAAIAALLLMLIGGLWFVFPQWSRRRPRKR